jgi:hypothetical protein
MTHRDRRLMLVAAAATSTAVILAALAGHAELVAYLAPVCALALPLLAGRYLGEDTLDRLRGRREPSRRRRERAPRPAGGARRTLAAFPRGGRLIAHALAERGPPATALT